MMHRFDNIEARTLNGLTLAASHCLLTCGFKQESRNGNTLELLDLDIYLTSPRNRHLYLKGRTNNIYGALAEVFWVLAGENRLDPLMKIAVPRSPDYSDDGGLTWRGAYGSRIIPAMENIFKVFKKDGINSRRAVINIWDQHLDTFESIKDFTGLDDSKDIPCSNMLWFWIRNNKLYLKLGMRSNDLIFGCSNINVLEFTILQEIVLECLKNSEILPKDAELGYYHHSAISFHLYDSTKAQAENMTSSENEEYNRVAAQWDRIHSISLGKLDWATSRLFFREIYASLCGIIAKNQQISIKRVFDNFAVPTEGNALFDYALAVEYWLEYQVAGMDPIRCFNQENHVFSPDFLKAMKHSKFTPKEWELK